MRKEKSITELKGEIEELGLGSLKKYLEKSPEQLIAIKPNVLQHMNQQAKLGMQFEREMNIDKRANERNHIRVFKITATDKTELKRLIKQKLPDYF